mmetsp:Transcript_2201/g.5135  ORF Transcript_2201/g.5135 Transcript_2201/m.5135 type:complete len:280 (+) Transcript_2201:1167-2006(+)
MSMPLRIWPWMPRCQIGKGSGIGRRSVIFHATGLSSSRKSTSRGCGTNAKDETRGIVTSLWRVRLSVTADVSTELSLSMKNNVSCAFFSLARRIIRGRQISHDINVITVAGTTTVAGGRRKTSSITGEILWPSLAMRFQKSFRKRLNSISAATRPTPNSTVACVRSTFDIRPPQLGISMTLASTSYKAILMLTKSEATPPSRRAGRGGAGCSAALRPVVRMGQSATRRCSNAASERATSRSTAGNSLAFTEAFSRRSHIRKQSSRTFSRSLRPSASSTS